MARIDRTNDTHHVYRCFDSSGRLVYVGSSANLFGRLAQHQASSWWAPTVAKVKAEVYPNGIVAREVERRAIREEVPRWNKAGKWAGRHLWTRSDWLDWLTLLLHATGKSPRFVPASVRDTVNTYESLFTEPLPEPFLTRIRDLEEESRLRRDREAEESRLRRIEVEREDELGAARERKERMDLGAPSDCVCTIAEVKVGIVSEYCDAHEDAEVSS